MFLICCYPGFQYVNPFLYLLALVKVSSLSHIQLFVTPLTVAYQAPPSVGFSRQEYLRGLPGDLPVPGIEPRSSALQTGALPAEPPGKPTCFRLVVKQVQIHSKKVSFSYFPPPHFMILMFYFTSSCLSFCCLLWLLLS